MVSPNMTVYKGNTLSMVIKTSVSVANSSILFTVKELDDTTSDDTKAVIKKSFSNIDDTSFLLELSETDTNIPNKVYEYDFKIVRENFVKNSDPGKFIVIKGKTLRDG